jgi:secondary thiamine-phosphate synthase enzyme
MRRTNKTMTVMTKIIHVESKGESDITDITREVERVVGESGVQNGIVALFVQGSTGALTTVEYEDGLIKDLSKALERLAPKNVVYEHEKRWHDGNGHSHIKASIIGSSLVVPFAKRRLTLGPWQQIVFIELDTRSRSRDLVVQIVGE